MRAIPPSPERWPQALTAAPFDQLRAFAPLLSVPDFVEPMALSPWLADAWPAQLGDAPAFVTQTPALLSDGLHFEARIRSQRQIATRALSWHDLYSALSWCRFPRLKWALNAWQVHDLAALGPKQRSRRQQALTHIDEAGVLMLSADRGLLEAIDAHDWHSAFIKQASSWGRHAHCLVFGHALYELMMQPRTLLAAKAILLHCDQALIDQPARAIDQAVDAVVAAAVASGHASDPKDLPNLPLSGIPGWGWATVDADFVNSAPCFRGKPPDRQYAPIWSM